MKIKTIKNLLSLADKNIPVIFDFCGCVPTTVSSWRGVYREPAIGWAATGYSGGGDQITVEEFLAELEKATSGKVYIGWKGGEFTYTNENTLHVDNPGEWTSTEITAVEVGEYSVILHTKIEDVI